MKNSARKSKNESAQTKPKDLQSRKKKDDSQEKKIVYQIKTKRTSDVLKAYITFTYRIMHPSVSYRLMIYGLILLLPGIFYFKDLYWKIFFMVIGIALILLGFFRQYISLAMTKKNDPDYQSGAEFTYNFTANDADFLRNGEYVTGLSKYKDITRFYYDDKFYYLGVRERELYILPKAAFTIGDEKEFEEFIYKKCKVTCKWLPDNFKDQRKQRQAYKRMNSNQ